MSDKKLRIVSFSDAHGLHDDIVMPNADIAIFSGDAGTYRSPYNNESSILSFIDWYASIKNVKHKIWIAGNHCTSIEHGLVDAKKISEEKGLIYLQHDSIEVEGLKIFGSPYTPTFGYGWAFNKDRGESIKKYWDEIPMDTEIIVVHGPPYGIHDTVLNGDQVGCKDLLDKVKTIDGLKLVQFGHIHEDYGHSVIDGVHYANASVLNVRYKLVNKPFVFEVDENKNFKLIDDGNI